MPPVSKARMIASGAGLLVIVAAFGAYPIWAGKHSTGGKSLTTRPEALGGHQVMRGAYINSGSIDAGADPNWVKDPNGKGLVYVGKPTHNIDERVVEEFKAKKLALQAKPGDATAASDLASR